MKFEKGRGGSMCLNHPELVHKHPAYLVSPVTMYFGILNSSSLKIPTALPSPPPPPPVLGSRL